MDFLIINSDYLKCQNNCGILSNRNSITMRRSILTFAFTISTALGAFAQNIYQYTADIANIKNDQVAITLNTPTITQQEVVFSFPKAIPGSYARKDYGRFIIDLEAFDKAGKKLKLNKLNDNQYSISNATTLDKISYRVKDTWDEKHPDFIFQPGGSNIEAGVNVVMNNHAFYGYFEGMADLPFEIAITRPADFYGATHLDVNRTAAQKDVIKAKNYVYLADNPIIYAKPDTTSFYEGKSKINIAVFSATGKVKSAQVAAYLKPISAALNKFFNGLPVSSYQFLYYFEDPAKALADRSKGEGGYGALEHNYSSLYYLPEMTLESRLKSMVYDVSMHEFLHIQTPLNLHSNEIEHFNFTAPVMSQHLWLYEGITEYFAQLVQVQNGLTNEKQFFAKMREKMNEADEFGDFSMTEMSKRVMEDSFQKKYSSVYSRGALLGLMLDLDIREKTGGKKDLKQVIAELSKKYGPNRPFDDNKLFDEFVAASHPGVKDFLDKYIVGPNAIPYQEYFSKIGYEYAPTKDVQAYYPGKMGLRYDEPTKSFLFTGVEANPLGIAENDVFKAIDGVAVSGANIDEIWGTYFKENTQHPSVSFTVVRKGEQKTLSGRILEGQFKTKHYLEPMPAASAQQKQLLSALIGK